MFIDARIPVLFGTLDEAAADDALLIDGTIPTPPGRTVARIGAAETPPHAAGCLCCVPRGQAGEALGRLFQARARGEVAFFRRVLVVVADADAVRRAVRDDRLASAWFRLG
jgi:hypothetical protein